MQSILQQLLANGHDINLMVDGVVLPVCGNLPATEGNAFQFNGRVWNLAYAGLACQEPDSIGLGYCQALIVQPRKYIHVNDLVTGATGEMPGAKKEDEANSLFEQDAESDDSGPCYGTTEMRQEKLDDKTVCMVKRRIAVLKAEIAVLKAEGSLIASEEREEERQRLVQYLRANSWSSRRQEFCNRDQRNRKSVGNAITRAIKRLQFKHPALAAHLSRSIETGMECRYQPERPTEWVL